MRNIRESILQNRFPEFVQDFMSRLYPAGDYDEWAVEALASVNITLRRPADSQTNTHSLANS